MSEIPSDLPVSNVIHVKEYREHFRTKKWWSFTVLGNKFGHDEVSTYLFVWDDKKGRWKRTQKFSVKNELNWSSIKNATDDLLAKIRSVR